mgnify:CR=1 FL=1
MSVRAFVASARLYWKTFATVALAVLAVGFAWLVLTPAQYVSNAQLLVAVQGSSTANAYQNDDVTIGRVNSYVALLTSDVVAQRVIDKLALATTPAELAAKISAVNVPPSTALIDIAVTDTSPEQARQIADAVATEFVGYTESLESPTGEDAQQVKTTVVSGASEPKSRLVERVATGVLIAALAALLGSVAVWMRAATDPVVRTPSQAFTAVGVPVLGVFGSARATSLAELEAYRGLRARLRGVAGHDDWQVLQISPVDGHADAQPVAENLGRALMLGGGRCVVVDEKEGFPDSAVDDDWATHPSIATTRFGSALRQLRQDYPHILIATPSVQADVAASAVCDFADSVVLLLVAGRTTRRDAGRAVKKLRMVGVEPAGVMLLTGARSGRHSGVDVAPAVEIFRA